jgi:3-isopropylmalate dehydrogenase
MPTPVSRDRFVADIVLLPGDGIGPEIARAASRLLGVIGSVEIESCLIGGCSIDRHGVALTEEVLARCKNSDGVLLAAVGGLKWDSTRQGDPRPEDGLLLLRKQLGDGAGLYANLRPVRPYDALLASSPLKEDLVRGTDLLIIRELTGGIYYGDKGRRLDSGVIFDTCEYRPFEIERVAKVAFETAATRGEAKGGRGKLTSVDKANVMETSRAWRQIVTDMAPKFPTVDLDHLLVDNAAMQLMARPSDFDVILTENTFGDILSDQASMLAGSLGMLPSASIDHYPPGLFEPIHGSAPAIAGQGIANPLAMLLSIGMMFRYGLGRFPNAGRIADSVENAVESVLEAGFRTPDLVAGGASEGAAETQVVDMEEMTDAVIDALELPEEPWVAGAKTADEYWQELKKEDPAPDAGALQLA